MLKKQRFDILSKITKSIRNTGATLILSKKTLEKLRILINEETEYRSGPQLVSFFNSLGFNDVYGQGFPSRWQYTDDRLRQINGSPELDKCIRTLFNPANFIENFPSLDSHIDTFNKYLVFDKWKIIRNGIEIRFQRLEHVDIDEITKTGKKTKINEFLQREYIDIAVANIGLESVLTSILEKRIKEIEKCFFAEAYLSTILLAGSTLEGLLLGVAIKYPKNFNSSNASPKDKSGKVKPFHDWNLYAFIEVAKELNYIQSDTHQFSHILRDFRNYIHPYQQMSSKFDPLEQTAKICLQVLKAAIYEIGEKVRGE